MPDSLPAPARRRAGRTSYVIGAALVVISLALCGGGGLWFAGPAVRASQGPASASIGYAVFDMHQGDEYWLYEPAGQPLPDSIECTYGSADDESFVVRRAANRPFGAERTITDLGDEFTFYGTFRGDRTESFVLIDCPPDDFAVQTSRAPLWLLLASVAGGLLAGLVGLAVVVVATVRHRPRRAGRPATAGSPAPGAPAPLPSTLPPPPGTLPPPPGTLPPPPGTLPPPPGTLPPPGAGAPARPNRRTRPSPVWYATVLPFGILAVIACLVGLCGGLATGFTDSFDPPEVGDRRAGTVSALYKTEIDYLLYYDTAEDPPVEPASCVMRDTDFDTEGPLRVRPDRPLGVPETLTHDGTEFRYFGTFQLSGFSLNGQVACEGESTLLARTTTQPRLLMAVGVGVGLTALLVAAGIGIFLSARRRR